MRLNGPIIQAIKHSMNRTTAVRRSGVSAEIHSDQALRNRMVAMNAAYARNNSRSSMPPSTWSSSITGNPAAIVAMHMITHAASLPSTISAADIRVTSRKSRVRRSRSLARVGTPRIKIVPISPQCAAMLHWSTWSEIRPIVALESSQPDQ